MCGSLRDTIVESASGRVTHEPRYQSTNTRFSHFSNMAQQQNSTLANIREYVKDARELQDDAMDFDASNIEARLEDTVKELQARVQEQQAALEEVGLCPLQMALY